MMTQWLEARLAAIEELVKTLVKGSPAWREAMARRGEVAQALEKARELNA